MPVGSAADKQEKLVRQLQQQEANKRCINCKSVRYSIMCVSILLALWWTEGRARACVYHDDEKELSNEATCVLLTQFFLLTRACVCVLVSLCGVV